ncbi:MAG TPA: hypothetical protein V6C58_24620 [Allocoleopsis sp.]
MEIKFKPYKRQDGKYAYQIFVNDKSRGFVHWIESTDGRICKINRPDMVMSPTFSLEQAEAECNWLTEAFKRGEIK